MTRDEFINQCVLCGYASQRTARAYAEGKESLTEADFIEAYRLNERMLSVKSRNSDDKYRHYGGAKTTKHLLDDEGNR